jgi:predicted AlkP superfamily pyrophosphatase or phosphodiesterase
MPTRYLLQALVAVLLALAPQPASAADSKAKDRAQTPPIVILISIDGFRPSNLRQDFSPTLDALADSGLSGSLRPSFPTLTFPNHYAMVTGRKPDSSGIVANVFEDPARPGIAFKLSDQKQLDDPVWWDAAEPIWVTAEKMGIRTATMFWPGSTAKIHGVLPSDWRPYDKTMPSDQRAATVIEWLRRPAATRPRFITLYFDEVDTIGHVFGPRAPETVAAIGRVDQAIAKLREAISTLGLSVNMVIVSDHGMAATSAQQSVDGPFTTIVPTPGKEASVAAGLIGRHGKMSCWAKDQVPPLFDYGHNARVAPIVCMADFGWQISQGAPARQDKGAHGYDPGAPDMAALFIGHGPAFPNPKVFRGLDNLQVYPLLAKLIGVTPLANDADAKINAIKKPRAKAKAIRASLVEQIAR